MEICFLCNMLPAKHKLADYHPSEWSDNTTLPGLDFELRMATEQASPLATELPRRLPFTTYSLIGVRFFFSVIYNIFRIKINSYAQNYFTIATMTIDFCSVLEFLILCHFYSLAAHWIKRFKYVHSIIHGCHWVIVVLWQLAIAMEPVASLL